MGFRASLLFCLAFSATTASADWSIPFPFPLPGVIYGDDDRHDLYEISDPRILQAAASSVALFRREQLSFERSEGRYRLALTRLGDARRLCPDEPFADQLAGASCSGVLVAPDLVLTAGHCLRAPNACADTSFVFGFALRHGAAPAVPQTIPASDVYSCSEIIARRSERQGADFALVRLERPVLDHSPIEIEKDPAPIAVDTPLTLVGHPLGLPTKITTGGKARAGGDTDWFRAETDAYTVNSGSAVVDSRSGKLVGVLIRGEADFSFDFVRQCRFSLRLPAGTGRGEDVTRASAILPHLP